MDLELKRTKLTSLPVNESLADRKDGDNFRRGPANVSKKASGQKRSSHPWWGLCEIQCQRGSLDERRPGHSSKLRGRLIDELPADKKSRLVMNEKSSR